MLYVWKITFTIFKLQAQLSCRSCADLDDSADEGDCEELGKSTGTLKYDNARVQKNINSKVNRISQLYGSTS